MNYKTYEVRVYENGGKAWYQDNKRHRLDGPAVENADGDKYWYQEGQLHRLDGPTIEYTNGRKDWYHEGKRHRLDGPAIECADGSKMWYIDNKPITEEEFNQRNQTCVGKVVEIDGKRYKLTEV